MATQSGSSSQSLSNKPQPAPSLMRIVIAMVWKWRRRAQSRGELALLSEAELRDIGYPAGLEAEKSKPFWQA